MILRALTRHYEDLLRLDMISKPGWGRAKVSYGLELSDNGEVLGLLDLRRSGQRKGKTEMLPQEMTVPMPVQRSSGVSANFLCDNSSYLLGADEKGNPKRTRECFEASKKLHLSLLGEAQSPAAKAVVSFFEKWNPSEASEYPAFAGRWAELMKGANLIFWYEEDIVQEEPEVRDLWQSHYDQTSGGEPVRCLITGELSEPAGKHPHIKGVQGAQSSGAALVSFNAAAFQSYGQELAQVGSYAAFAYTTALNHLLADWEHVRRIGDTTVVCWAEGGQSAYQEAGSTFVYGDAPPRETDIQQAVAKLAKGESVDWNAEKLNPSTRFYILGLAPNAGRLSVRFFWQDSFGALVRNVMEHYKALEIVRPKFEQREMLSVDNLLKETVNRKAKNQEPAKRLPGELLRAVLTREQYPAALLHGVMLRIRAELKVTYGRAAILKAYYLRDRNSKMPKEVLEMKLNESCDYVPYVLGRLFSVLESLQEYVHRKGGSSGINSTIRDRYFNSASATPMMVFPTLVNLAMKHLHKLETPAEIYYNKQIADLLGRIKEPYPKHMNLMEQGAFQLGYYHEMQKRYTKKEEQ